VISVGALLRSRFITSRFTRKRRFRWYGGFSLVITLAIVINDSDRFYWGDLMDSINNGGLHHEPFTVLFLLAGIAFIAASFFQPG
jgi:hypothetical protein